MIFLVLISNDKKELKINVMLDLCLISFYILEEVVKEFEL